jgi:hypothetical protein
MAWCNVISNMLNQIEINFMFLKSCLRKTNHARCLSYEIEYVANMNMYGVIRKMLTHSVIEAVRLPETA